MPMRPKRPCAYAGCIELIQVGTSYCDVHKRQKGNNYKKDTDRYWHGWYSTTRWKAARKAFLVLHPLCVECEQQGRLRPATVVDHIKPHRGDVGLFWDRSNWQALCTQHHNLKTAKEDGGFGNKRK